MQLRVRSITYLAEAINGYELVDPRGRDLPRFEAGAHIELRVGGFLRQYSLWNDPAERRRYCIAVLRESESQGGSQYLHETVRAGDLVEVSMPRNNFPLDATAARHLLIAGGIGIAPIISMISELRRRHAEFEVHYCTRSPEKTAFRGELEPLVGEQRLQFHHDGGNPAHGLDIAAALRDPVPGTHLYYCGPAPLMAAAAQAAVEWPPGTVHCEYFTTAQERILGDDRPFRVSSQEAAAIMRSRSERRSSVSCSVAASPSGLPVNWAIAALASPPILPANPITATRSWKGTGANATC